MVLPDVNLLVYTYNSDAPYHEQAKAWWTELLEGERPVVIPWLVIVGCVRLLATRAVLESPYSIGELFEIFHNWFERSHVAHLEPGPRHLEIFRDLLLQAKGTGTLSTDAHLAALAIEHSCELHSNDADFARFPNLRWVNPLEL